MATGAQLEIVISEILCYMQNTISRVNHDFVIKTVVDFYSRDAIHDAKSLLFEKCEMTAARFRSYNKDAAKMDSRDIVIKLNEVGCNCPTFVAKEIAKLPLTTPDAFDLAKISKDIDDVLRIKENVINSFTTLTCLQNDFQLVRKQSNKIDELSENISSLELLVEKKQARRVIVSSDSDTDTDTSQSAIDTDYDGDADIDGEDDDDGDDDGVGEDDNDDGEDDKRGSLSIRETVNDRQTVNTKPTTRNREPVLRLTDRPPELKPWMTDGGFNIVGKNGKTLSIKRFSDAVCTNDRVYVNSALRKRAPQPMLKAVQFVGHKNLNRNSGYFRPNKRCEIFVSRLVPTTTSRDMSLYLKSKYSQSLHVQQIHTKYDRYASFKITAPPNMKADLLNRKNWINDVYVREFKGKFQY